MTEQQEARLKIKKLPGIDTIVVEKISSKDGIFLTNDRAIAISTSNLSRILHFLVIGGYLSPRVLEGILEDYYSNR